jgi:tetratricopeptide (TPR) repeat protein
VTTTRTWPRRPWLWAGLLVGVVTVAVHAGGLGGDFVYDDHRFLRANDDIRSIPWLAAFTDPSTASHDEGIQHDIYRPLRTLLFAFEYALFADEDAGVVDFNLPAWHLVSVLLHTCCALLVLRLLAPVLRGALLPATAGALLFAVHPVTSESVAWLSSQGDILALALGLTALVVMERPGVGRTLAGGACFALACFAKESALMLPGLLLLRDLALPRHEAPGTPWPRATCARAGLLVALAGAYFAVRLGVIDGLAQVPHPEGSRLATARAMLHGLAWYAGALFWPAGFSFDTRIDVPLGWMAPEVWLGFGVLGTLLAAGVYGLCTKRYVLAFATLGFLVTLAPVSNVIVPLKAFVADRFLYPGLVCVAAGLAALVRVLPTTARATVVTVFIGVLAVLAARTMDRNAAWADEFSLWDAVRRDRPANPNAYQGIAFVYAQEGNVALAERAYASYLEANPADGKSLLEMGDLFGQVAESLVPLDGRFDPTTNMRVRHKQALYAQLALYRRALLAWEGPGGLRRGRGSERMRRSMLTRWIEAAVDLGDLREAKFASDYLIDLEAEGYDHTDTAAVGAKASWWSRRARVLLALRAVASGLQREMPADQALRRRSEEDRAAVLRDVGLDPARKDTDLLPDLEERVGALIREALAATDVRPDRGLFLQQAWLHDAMGRPDEARRALRAGLAVYPDDPILRRALGGR